MPDMEKVIRIIDELIFEAQKAPTWKAENALRCLKKELLKEQEQKTGHWTTKRTLQHDGEWYCDQCEYEPTVFENTPFCPNCGAKMEGR